MLLGRTTNRFLRTFYVTLSDSFNISVRSSWWVDRTVSHRSIERFYAGLRINWTVRRPSQIRPCRNGVRETLLVAHGRHFDNNSLNHGTRLMCALYRRLSVIDKYSTDEYSDGIGARRPPQTTRTIFIVYRFIGFFFFLSFWNTLYL